jgi:class 3 adenylate cyclase
MSVISFLKIISGIKKSRKLIKYKENKGLNERMPNYSVKMGFGLHVGWAIEGAIGSFYKIDASYLSPNVNMASRLEAATKQFGVQLLVSGEFISLMSPLARSNMR